MNSKIKALNKKLSEVAGNAADIETQLQVEWNKVFDDMTQLRKAVNALECSDDYATNEYGDIISWTRFDTSDFKDCQNYLKEYMRDSYCVDVDFQNDALSMSHGDDNLIIQDDSRHSRDNGVWQSHKQIIAESDYKTEDGEIDETKRNELIEAYMEKTGHFPGVYRIDYHGNVFSVNTAKGRK